ncbi:MAG: ABC transporter ATP-binding protein [Anaerolineae bacterium]|nr:ABC transporter ATP-binding protein [Anaerolineae bacterium]
MLQIRRLEVDYEGDPVLRGLDLEVASGEVVAVLGPSGCGKTTLLRTIAGLETPRRGDVRLDGRSLLGVPPHKRGVGLMFQSFALFPHLSVLDNVAFGLEMQGGPREASRTRARELLALVGMEGFEQRAVSQLSGGEQQRVALARSLAPSPRLLMLDEPLGSLDAALRDYLTIELRAIFRRVGLTALYVTHDQREALVIADRIAVLREGQVEQIGTPEAIYRAPASEFTADFLGLGNCLPREIVGRWLPGLDFPAGAPLLLLHPEGISLGEGGWNLPEGIVQDCAYLGDVYRVSLSIEGQALTVRVPLRTFAAGPVRVGDTVRASVDSEWISPLRPG